MLHIYMAGTQELEDELLYQELYEKLPKERKEKIDRLRFVQDKRLSLGAWLLLQEGLLNLGVPQKNRKISYGVNGKPYLSDMPELFFNLSHSGSQVMCALSDCEVGCDVEQIKDRGLKIAGRFFTAGEYQLISEKETPEERNEMFYRLWTLKESFMKAAGLGMKLPLDSFEICFEKEKVTVHTRESRKAYTFGEYHYQEGYCYASCVEGEGCRTQPRIVCFRSMENKAQWEA